MKTMTKVDRIVKKHLDYIDYFYDLKPGEKRRVKSIIPEEPKPKKKGRRRGKPIHFGRGVHMRKETR